MAYPQPVRVSLPEVGPDAWMEVHSPFMLPVVRTTPTDDPHELHERAKKRFASLIPAWSGVVDITTGEELPPPKDDPESMDKCPEVIWLRMRIAMVNLKFGEQLKAEDFLPSAAPANEEKSEGTTDPPA